jgi:predicted ATPase
VAHYALGSALGWLGEFARAREQLDQALALNTHQPHSRSPAVPAIVARVASHCYAAFTLWVLGYPDQALERGHEALTLAHELEHPYSIGVALHYAGWVHWLRCEAPAVLEHAEAQIALSTQHGFGLWLAGGTILRGCALAKQGPRAEGMRQLQQGIAAWRATGADAAVPFYLCLLAEAYGEAGRTEKAQHLLREALALVEHKGERFWEAELHRLQGELRLRQPSPNELQGEASFHQALVVARRQNAKSLELRAVMSLARLWQRQGKRHDARRILADIYGWFCEGFDTTDLQEARTLLAEFT